MGTLVPIRAQEGGVPREILAVIPPEPDLGQNTPFLASDGHERRLLRSRILFVR